jgi:hypothetical protein
MTCSDFREYAQLTFLMLSSKSTHATSAYILWPLVMFKGPGKNVIFEDGDFVLHWEATV